MNKGDTINFGFTIRDSETKNIIKPENINDIVFQINNDVGSNSIELLLSRNEISYNEDGEFYYFTLDQEQTFGLNANNKYQIRVLDHDNHTLSNDIGSFNLNDVLNHRILGGDEDEM